MAEEMPEEPELPEEPENLIGEIQIFAFSNGDVGMQSGLGDAETYFALQKACHLLIRLENISINYHDEDE